MIKVNKFLSFLAPLCAQNHRIIESQQTRFAHRITASQNH